MPFLPPNQQRQSNKLLPSFMKTCYLPGRQKILCRFHVRKIIDIYQQYLLKLFENIAWVWFSLTTLYINFVNSTRLTAL